MLTVLAGMAVVALTFVGSGLVHSSGVDREKGEDYRTEGNVGLGLIALAIALAFAL